MLVRRTVIFIRWCTTVICIGLFMPAYFKEICTKNGQCSEANTTCVKQLDGSFVCQLITQTNQTISISSTEDENNTNQKSEEEFFQESKMQKNNSNELKELMKENSICTNDSQCSQSHAACIKQLDGMFHCQLLTQNNQTLNITSIEDKDIKNQMSVEELTETDRAAKKRTKKKKNKEMKEFVKWFTTVVAIVATIIFLACLASFVTIGILVCLMVQHFVQYKKHHHEVHTA